MSTGLQAPAGSSAATGNNQRIQQTQNQIDDIVDIMTVNVDKMLERDLKLSELGDPADALQMGAFPSATSAALKEKILRKYWWKNYRTQATGISILVVIIVIIVWCIS
uniref:V-SNARE coiled-coil homology domain-containing protein n=1 Tax=Spermophilus dauricus TaxID=99837 RepID=A0A8C9URH2_SPEDA